MVRKKHRIIYWTPRVLAILLTTFVFFMAFGCFDKEANLAQSDQEVWGIKQMSICYTWQLIPAIILGVITAIAWRLELYGGFLFFVAGVVSFIFFWQGISIISFLLIPGMAMFIGLMFWLCKYLRKDKDDLIIC